MIPSGNMELIWTIVLMSLTATASRYEMMEEDADSSTIDDVHLHDRFERSTVECGTLTIGASGGYRHVRPRLRGNVLARSLVDRIVGGTEARHGEIPWQARVRPYDNDGPSDYGCGAVIINEFWLLSAAHCFYGTLEWERRIIVGKHHLYRAHPGEQQFRVDMIYTHENYTEATKDYDIALIRIQPSPSHRGIEFNKYVKPICLPGSATPLHEGTKLQVSGWGWTKPCRRCNEGSQEYADVLMKADIPLIGQDTCQRLYKKRITDRMFCAGYTDGIIDACKGDSGGPVVYQHGGHYWLYGIVSWGGGCAQSNKPGVYTNVTSCLPWIDGIIKLNSPQLSSAFRSHKA